MDKYSVENLELAQKKVFLRVDFNLPLDTNNQFSDLTRLVASLPTIQYLLEKGASIAIFSHLGRPQGKETRLSLEPLATILAKKLTKKVFFCPSMSIRNIKEAISNNKIVLVENTRFFPEEQNPNQEFCRVLARLFDHYVNDSFGTAHRKEASNYAIARCFKTPACGLLIKKELANMSFLLNTPPTPFIAILGGSKLKDKIAAIQNLINLVDKLLLGGGMAYTFLQILGKPIGRSIVDKEHFSTVEKLLKNYQEKIILPQDHLVSSKIGAETTYVQEIPTNKMGVDIGRRTILQYAELIHTAKTIFWNGPLGVFEVTACANGTFSVARAVASSDAVQFIGGGDSILAINKLNLVNKIRHLSTGGGAAIEFVSGKILPAIEVLKDL